MKHYDNNTFLDQRILTETERESVAPIRVKFGRADTEAKKKRREQSAQFSQKLIDEDSWIQLEVQTRVISKLVFKCNFFKNYMFIQK